MWNVGKPTCFFISWIMTVKANYVGWSLCFQPRTHRQTDSHKSVDPRRSQTGRHQVSYLKAEQKHGFLDALSVVSWVN